MLAIEQPRPAHKKPSIFRRFSRKNSVEEVVNQRVYDEQINHDVYNAVIRTPPTRLRKRSLSTSLPATPLSPTRFKNDSVIDVKRSPSPHLTKDKSYRKDRTITHIQRIVIPQIIRERLSRESSSSSTSSQRVQPDAIPTSPFPSTHINVTPWDIYLPPAQVHALYMGYHPSDMSDKWYIYSEGPDVMGKLKVHFHRSWTGQRIAEVFVVMDVKGEGAGKIVGVKWNAGDMGSGKMTGEEAKYLVRTTVKWVLGVELEEGR